MDERAVSIGALRGRASPGQGGDWAVLLHPHPAYGADMEHPVIRDLAAELQARGLRTLRFDFGTASRGPEKVAAAEWLARGGRPDGVALIAPPLAQRNCAGAKAYQGPVLVVAAGYDLYAPLRTAREFAAALPRAELVELPEADHFFNHGSPVVAVGAWLERLRGAERGKA